MDAGGDVEDDGHSEGAHQVHFGLDQSAEHVAELVFLFVGLMRGVLLLWGCYNAVLVVFDHGFVQFLSEVASAV